MRRRYIETYRGGAQGTDFLEVWADHESVGFRTTDGNTCFLSSREQQQNLVEFLQQMLAGKDPIAPTPAPLWRDIE